MDEQLSWLPPDWLDRLSRKAAGRDLNKFRMLDEFYKEVNALHADRFDKKHYEKILGSAEELQKLADSKHEDSPSWADIVQDMFLGFYKAAPKLHGESEMKPSHKVNLAAMAKGMGTKEWEELRTYTQLDQWAAAMAALEFGMNLSEIFDEMSELMEAQQGAQEQEESIDDLLDRLEQESGEDMTEDKANELLDELQQALDSYEAASDALDQVLDGLQGEMRQAAKQAASQALEATQNVSDMVSGFGTDAGALSRMDGERRMKLAARIRNNHKLRELAEMVGRFKALALSEQASKVVHGRDEIHDVELGDDVGRLLASEYVNLASPELEVLFYEKFAEKKLLQYALRGTEKVSRGAIIMMIDCSGSMSGTREMWAKAVGLALLDIAHKQKRDYHAILFSSRGEIREWQFPNGVAGPEDVLDFAEYFYGGGTDFESPISRAVEVLERQYNDDGAQKGDLVLVTDGECAVGDEWLKRYKNAKDDLAFRMYGCLIGVRSPTVDILSDQMYSITELARGDDVREIFGAI